MEYILGHVLKLAFQLALDALRKVLISLLELVRPLEASRYQVLLGDQRCLRTPYSALGTDLTAIRPIDR